MVAHKQAASQALRAPVRLTILFDLTHRRVGVPSSHSRNNSNKVRPADFHLSGNGVESIFRGRLQRDARDIPEHQGSAAENDLEIRPRHVGDAVGRALFRQWKCESSIHYSEMRATLSCTVFAASP